MPRQVAHPAAKMVVLAAKAQQAEVGDGANLVVSLAGELLAGAEALLRDGLHASEIMAGYSAALGQVYHSSSTTVTTVVHGMYMYYKLGPIAF